MQDEDNVRRAFAAWRARLAGRIERTRMIVALLGSGGAGLEERRAIAADLAHRGIVALVPEDDLPREVSPSLAEPAMLARGDLDLVFLNVDSWGSASELGQFQRDFRVASKLRILVAPEHHPLAPGDRGYLKDLYLTHLALFGHVYAIDGGLLAPVPSASEVVVSLSDRHRQVKPLHPEFIK